MIVWPENVLTRVVPLINGGLWVPEKKQQQIYLSKRISLSYLTASYRILKKWLENKDNNNNNKKKRRGIVSK